MALKVFVTGATGLIGSATVRALAAGGHQVFGLTSRASNAALVQKLGATPVVGDMRDAAAYRDVARSADAIVHAAAAFPDKMRYSPADVDAFMGADAEAVDALIASAGSPCRAFVFSSGAYDYGDTGPTPVDETHSTERHHLVMRRKLQTEAKLLGLAKEGRLPVMITRPGMVYGNGSLWGKFYFGPMSRGRRAMIPGNGRNVLSFIHADDAGGAYRLLVERPTPGEIYNLGDDQPATLGEVARAQAKALGAPAPFTTPGWLVRLIAGPYSGAAALSHNTVSNRKLKALGYAFKYPTYHSGVTALAEAARAG